MTAPARTDAEQLARLRAENAQLRQANEHLRGRGMTPRDREVFIALVRFVDGRHEFVDHGGCRYVLGVDACEVWCEACRVLVDVTDDVLRKARDP